MTPRSEKKCAAGRLATEHYENYPVGSFLVPRALRPHVHRIYAFARTADDLADEARDAQGLADYRESFLAHVAGGAADVPLFVDLAATIREKALPLRCFTDLLDAFAEDLTTSRHDERSLLSYCTRSADPVGRLILRLFGHDDARLDAWSDSICTALQLLNHLQDLRSDYLERDRIYFPLGGTVDERDLGRDVATPELRSLVRAWTDRCAAMLRAGWPLIGAVRGRLRLELRAIVCAAAAVVRRVRAQDHDVLCRHARLRNGDKLRALARALTRRALPPELR